MNHRRRTSALAALTAALLAGPAALLALPAAGAQAAGPLAGARVAAGAPTGSGVGRGVAGAAARSAAQTLGGARVTRHATPAAGTPATARVGTPPVASALGVLPSTGSPTYKSLAPARVLDTRVGNGAPRAPLGAGRTLDLTVLGRGGVPATGVSAVVLNVTATGASTASFLAVYPTGTARPTASSVSVPRLQNVANLVMVKVGTGGKVTVYNSVGAVNVIADVQGYYQTGSEFTALTPQRILDTRTGNGAAQAPVGARATLDLQVLGRGGVPGAGVSAVALNLTATTATASSFVTAYPTGVARPVASNLNFRAGQTVSVAAVARVGTGGKVTLYNDSGSVNLIADVSGYFTAGGSYVPVTPQRILDTRRQADGALPAGFSYDIELTNWDEIPMSNVSAVVLSLTAVSPTEAGYLTEYPYGSALPNASNLNFSRGATVPNLVVAKVGAAGWSSVYNPNGSTHLVMDVVGYFRTNAVPQYTTGQQVVASVDLAGGMATSAAGSAGGLTAVSDSGRYVLFGTDARKMFPYVDASAGGTSVFVRDTVLGITSLVAGGSATNFTPLGMSGDGQRILWTTTDDLFQGDVNGGADIFVTDLSKSTYYQISWNLVADTPPNGPSTTGAISRNGQWIVFRSVATDLPGANGSEGVYRLAWSDGSMSRVGPGTVTTNSVSNNGDVAVLDPAGPRLYAGGAPVVLNVNTAGATVAGTYRAPSLSSDGTVAALSTASVLDPADTNGVSDVYLRTVSGTASTRLVTKSSTGGASGGSTSGSTAGDLSATGAVATLSSAQTNLEAAATDGDVVVHRWTASGMLRASTETAGTAEVVAGVASSTTSSGALVAYRVATTSSVSSPTYVIRLG